MKYTKLFVAVALLTVGMAAAASSGEIDYAIKLRVGDLTPRPMTAASAAAVSVAGTHVLIQFENQLSDADKDRLKSQGIELLAYVPNRAWVAKVSRNIESSDLTADGIRWYGQITPEQKLSPMITSGIGDFARRGGDKVQFAVVIQKDEDPQTWAERFKNQYGAEILGIEPSTNLIDLIMPESSYPLMAEEDAVLWMETALPQPVVNNNSSRDNIGATTVQASPYNLTGSGVKVAIWDGGRAYGAHPDLTGRVTELDASSYEDHASNVAGTILGTGAASSGTYKGMAPSALLFTRQWWSNASQAQTQYTYVVGQGARISSNSWGYSASPVNTSNCNSILGTYYTVDATLDNLVRGSGGSPINICWSAGNDRSTGSDYCGSIGFTYGTVGALATSKNVIAVGAINSNSSSMTSFSGWGPVDDGRVKPDVVGPGCQTNDDYGVTSCSKSGGYVTMCGTSQACPAVAGVVALMLQQRDTHFGSAVLPSTIKGILINTATDQGNTGPDYAYGHGRVDAVKACSKIAIGTPSYVEGSMTNGGVDQYDLTVPSGTSKLKVTLVWDDPGGTAIAGKDLINDLDLVLIDPSTNQTLSWALNPSSPSTAATKTGNHRDNVETAEVSSPAAGQWKARVTGYDVPQGPQSYSLVFTPDNMYSGGTQLSWAVQVNGDVSAPPGQTSAAQFWVKNVGRADSATVHVSDKTGWLTGWTDTTVVLAALDSVLITAHANVPAGLAAGVIDTLTCRATSKTDTTVVSQNRLRMIVAAVYTINVVPPAGGDTVASPQSYLFSTTVENTGNTSNTITVTPTNPLGWVSTPTSSSATLAAGGSTILNFTLHVPPDMAHLLTNTISLVGSSTGGGTDTSTFSVIVKNPVSAPVLVSPDSITYSRSRRYDFSWTGTADSFKLVIASDSEMTTPVRSYPQLTATTLSMPVADSLLDGKYYWGVKRYVGTDSSSFQTIPHRVVVDNVAPAALTLSSPKDKAIISAKQVTVSFSTPSQPGPTAAPEYTVVQLASDTGFTTNLLNYQPVASSPFAVPDTLAEGRWYWRARRVDLAGNVSPLAVPPSFIIDTKAPEIPTLTYPADSQRVSTNPVVLRWNTGTPPPYAIAPEYFYLHISLNAAFTDYSYTGYVYTDTFAVATPLLAQGQRYYWRVKALDSAGFYTAYSAGKNFLYQTYLCGDVNQSGFVDLTDLTYLVSYLTGGGAAQPPSQVASLNCDTMVDLIDLSILVSYLVGNQISFCCPN